MERHMAQPDSTAAQPGAAHATNGADGKGWRALFFGRRLYSVLGVTLAVILLAIAGFTAQGAFNQRGSGSVPGVFSAPQTATPAATASAEAPVAGWSRAWAFPIPATQRNGANPDLAWSPAQPQTLYLCLFGQPLSSTAPASPHSSLLFRSRDGGVTWRALTAPEPAARCAIYPDPTMAGRLALVDDHGNTYLSSDAGDSWQALPPPPDAATYGSRFEAVVAGRVYVGADWTRDLHTWTRWFFGSPAALTGAPVIDPLHPDTLYLIQQGCPGAPSTPAGAAEGVCRSNDGGHTWRYLLSTIPAPGPAPTVCLLPTQPETLFAWSSQLTLGGATLGSFARSEDGGATWATQGLPQEGQPPTFSPAASCSSQTDFYGSPLGGVDSVRDDGALYTTVTPADGDSRPSGVIVYRNGAWSVAAPNPLRANPYAPPAALWLPQSDGRYILLAVSESALYRYDTAVAG